ncbi:NAD-dependent epimerase/dehydratase family protein [Burkholderia glumae]|uniref:NAD-dependent epimerase/dehydratase family protein n=1 Tax=Burkholderia glumae TaxID=337 RepID=UPI000F5E911B|nr:GDP-mannose 4,6-dehydratase [Burkholderia glumae]MCQ0031952.1 GDP-mannose 4,6-dehydratase [Burkholderia glumae]MCQ0037050.1 GDP-mannose 4,6-dehydratase [Burkholderia glumae]QJW78490.1 NAD-dependent epimerase/dehydratase family protein [Burkholderia glumae]RQZ74842.1 NAD-dependent epimerase/dehydratase family protein [Burkholderia glumae]UVS83440.1 NAD-dependent epimerase/dehydratase family protein [Burkholderia glumae]
MAKALITGIGGFTGRHLAQELGKRGYEVHGLVHRPVPDLAWNAHVCDLLDVATLKALVTSLQPDVVIHLAAIAFVAHGDVGAVYATNIMGTRNLLEVVAAVCSPRAVLVASSANIYGNVERDRIDELVTPSPANDYAISKLAAENVARLWMERLPITIARPFNYTGAGQASNFLLPKIVDHFRRRAATLELGNLHVVRDFSDVRMVVRAYSDLVDGSFAGETFNICSGKGYSLQDVLSMMTSLTGHSPEIRVNTQFVRANEVHRLIGDNRRLVAAIGALDTIPLRDTLAWMLESGQ